MTDKRNDHPPRIKHDALENDHDQKSEPVLLFKGKLSFANVSEDV